MAQPVARCLRSHPPSTKAGRNAGVRRLRAARGLQSAWRAAVRAWRRCCSVWVCRRLRPSTIASRSTKGLRVQLPHRPRDDPCSRATTSSPAPSPILAHCNCLFIYIAQPHCARFLFDLKLKAKIDFHFAVVLRCRHALPPASSSSRSMPSDSRDHEQRMRVHVRRKIRNSRGQQIAQCVKNCLQFMCRVVNEDLDGMSRRIIWVG